MKELILKGVSKIYTGGYGAISSADFRIKKGERLTVIGSKLSGKTTLAKLIAGLERPTGGEITYDGRSDFKAEEINVGFYTECAMKKNASVYSAVEYPLKLRGLKDNGAAVARALGLFGIENLARLKLKDLGAEQKTLVALSRLFAVERDLYILDNPLETVPVESRKVLMSDIAPACKKVSGAVIFLTDWVAEAEVFGAMKNALLTYGTLSESKTLCELKKSPRSLAEAELIAEGCANKIEIKTDSEFIGEEFKKAAEEIPLIGEFSNITAVAYYDAFTLGIGAFKGTVAAVGSNIDGYLLSIDVGGKTLRAISERPFDEGAKINFGFKPSGLKLFDTLSEQSIEKI